MGKPSQSVVPLERYSGVQPVGTGLGVVNAERATTTIAEILTASVVEIKPLLRGIMIPMPPTINGYWGERIVFNKKMGRHMAMPYVTHEGKEYAKDIAERVMDARARFFTKSRLFMTLALCFRDARRTDLDNRIKPLQDSLKEAGVYEDDCQIDGVLMLRGPNIKEGRVVLGLHEVVVNANAVLDSSLSVKYIAGGYQAPVLDMGPAPSPQSGELFQDEVPHETGVRRSSRRGVASGHPRRTG